MINGGLQQLVWQVVFLESAIEAENKLVNVFLKVPMRYPMEGSRQKALEAADDNMNLRKLFRHFFGWSGLGFVPMRFAQHLQGIRANFRMR